MEKDTRVNVNCTGQVVAKIGAYLMVETIAIDKKYNQYKTAHNMKPLKGIKPLKGEYIHVEGHMDMDTEGVNFIDPTVCNILPEIPATEDQVMNAWITGEASSNFIEPESKTPFGVVSIKLQEKRFQRGIVFNSLISTFRKTLKTGAIVKIAGRLQYRTFEKDGVERTVVEIICDNNYSEVVKQSTKANPFAFTTDDTMAGIKRAVTA